MGGRLKKCLIITNNSGTVKTVFKLNYSQHAHLWSDLYCLFTLKSCSLNSLSTRSQTLIRDDVTCWEKVDVRTGKESTRHHNYLRATCCSMLTCTHCIRCCSRCARGTSCCTLLPQKRTIVTRPAFHQALTKHSVTVSETFPSTFASPCMQTNRNDTVLVWTGSLTERQVLWLHTVNARTVQRILKTHTSSEISAFSFITVVETQLNDVEVL